MTDTPNVPRTGTLSMPARIARQALPLAIAGACLWLVTDRIGGIDAGALRAGITGIAAWQWGLALLATAASFWAVGRYDVIIHRHLRTGIDPRRGAMAGAASIALAQTLGMGVATGAGARWRMLHELSLARAAVISAFVAVSFMIAWGGVTVLALTVLPRPDAVPAWAAPVGVLALAGTGLGLYLLPRLTRATRRFRPPSVIAMAKVLGLTALDTAFAALALWALLPEGAGIGFAQLYPVYLLALGAALVTGTPGGVGPFELTLLMLLPHVPEASLIAAVLAFRAVYYALPALAALPLLALRLPAGDPGRALPPLPARMVPDALLAAASRAECAVARQGAAQLLANPCGTHAAVLRRTGQTLCLMFGPVTGSMRDLAPRLAAAARAENRIPALYKLDARDAVLTRAAGFTALHIADEALVDPGGYNPSGSRYRQLRRKLRKAEGAGVTAALAPGALPLEEMQAISDAWEARNGPARGFSMGKFCPDYVTGQRVYLAHDAEGVLIAYVSFHAAAREWTLDIMRALPDAPDGTMHALIDAALRDAAAADLPRLSLAAVPASSERLAKTRLFSLIDKVAGGAGLRQFKACFAPAWRPLYLCAPGYLRLAIALVDIARAVRRSDDDEAQPASPVPDLANLHGPHDGYEEYAFARVRAS